MPELGTMLDEHIFYRYVSAGDAQMRLRIIELFGEQVEQYIADLEHALEVADLEQADAVLHKMKGTTAFIGALHLHALACDIMGAGQAERLQRLDSCLLSLKAGLRQTLDAMRGAP